MRVARNVWLLVTMLLMWLGLSTLGSRFAATVGSGVASYAEAAITFQGTGATSRAPLYQKWFTEYNWFTEANEAHPDAQIDYQLYPASVLLSWRVELGLLAIVLVLNVIAWVLAGRSANYQSGDHRSHTRVMTNVTQMVNITARRTITPCRSAPERLAAGDPMPQPPRTE